MAEINPDIHEYGYVFVPLNRVTAIFTSTDDARAAVKELYAMGVAPRDVDVFVGEQGASTLDLSGEGHGTATRRLRNLEAFMVQIAGNSHQEADEALKSGGVVVAVSMEGREASREDVAVRLRRHRARVIRYWSRWTIESLD